MDLPSITEVEQFLVTASASRAIAGGLLASWFGTQWFKRWLWPVTRRRFTLTEDEERLLFVSIAFLLGVVSVDQLGGTWFLMLLVGVSSPILYTWTMRALYHFWPWLEDKVSGQPPRVKIRADGMVGIKEGDDETQWVNPEK